MKIAQCRLSGLALAAWWLAWCAPLGAAEPNPAEAEIRASLAALAQAFNAHDAAGVATAWTTDAVYVDSATGEPLAGREQIQAYYARLFQDQPQVVLEAQLSEIELAGDAAAFARGVAQVRGGAAGEPTRTSFLAELAREEDRWRLVAVEESDFDPLGDLAWLVGTWEDEGGRTLSTFAWDTGGRFLVRSYLSETDAGDTIQGTQYIGWDPARGELRSWNFGSHGGLAEATWEPVEDHWSIHWVGSLGDGRQGTATQLLRPIDEDTFEVRWTGIDIDGELQPSTSPVTVRRIDETVGGSPRE